MRWVVLVGLLVLGGCGDEAAPVDAGEVAGDAGASFDGGAGASDAGARDAGGAVLDAGPGTGDAGPDPDAGPTGPTLDDRLAALEDPTASADDLDALLHEVAWAEGWPVTDGARWLFATRWDDAPDGVALVSDVNGWEPDAATRAASGVHYYVALEASDLVAAPEGAVYKWFGAADVYRAPPEARAYGFDSFGEHGLVAPPRDARWRERFVAFESAHLDAPRAFRAYLPAGFTPGDAARVLFMHDGQNVMDPGAIWGGWRVHEALADPAYDDVVVLAVDNAADRLDAYTHVPDDIGAGSTVGGRAADYARLVREEALPFFRAQYGLSAARDDLIVAGSSLGGLVSLYLALEHPSEMSCVIAMSSTLGWGAFAPSATGMDALVNRWTSHGSVAIYLDSGGAGPCVDTDGDGVDEDEGSDNYCTTVQLRDHLASLGYTYDADLFHWHTEGAPHNEAAWAERMPTALDACVRAGWTP